MPRQTQPKERQWYAIHTYSGYEDRVAENIRQRIESMDMADKIFDVIVPTEKQIEIRHGKRKTVDKKIFPGYVMVNMIVTDDSWFVVRNTPNVTGFIGTGTTPTPMGEDEVQTIKQRMGVEEPTYEVDLEKGETVNIVDGPFKDMDGQIDEVDKAKGKVKVLVNVFGRETPLEMDFLQVRKI